MFLGSNKCRIVLLTVLLSICALLLLSVNIKEKKGLHFFEKIILEVFSPSQKVIRSSTKGMASFFNNYILLIGLKEENDNLKKAINALKEENNQLREAFIANVRLRRLLNFKETLKTPIIPAEVVGEDPSPWFKTILIDKGNKHSIKKNMIVVTSDGIIGRTIQVSRSTSKVLLIIDHRSAIDAMVQRTRAKGILEGKAESNCRLKYVLRADDVITGDKIISSGLGGIFPKGLLLGKVSKIEKDNFGMFQSVEVTPSVNFLKLEEVLVLGNSSTNE